MRIDPQLIKDFQKNPYSILETLSIKEIAALLKQANYAYYQEGRPLFFDDIYEIIRTYLANLVPDHPLVQADVVGALPKKNKVELPIYMGSLDKIKDDPQQLDRWKQVYTGSYIISDKLDGISCLYVVDNNKVTLYSRGNGNQGQDISHLLKYIQNIPKNIPNETMIRGELILSKKNWQKIANQRTNPRNTVAGLANSKHPEPDIAKYVEFVCYECIQPKYNHPSKGMEWMKKKGFTVVHHKVIKSSELNVNHLSDVLMERRKKSEYEVDGVVVEHDAHHVPPEEGNPAYAFAFKSVLTMEKAEVVVKDVVWNVTKTGRLKPVAVFDTVFIGGAHISRATAHNAQMIEKHKIGPGSRIIVIRSGDVIPYILDVITPSSSGEPLLPNQIEFPWHWNETHVEIVLDNPGMAEDYNIRQLENYVSVLDIKGLGTKIIRKLYQQGIDNVKKLVNVTKIELYKATYSSKLTMKIYKNLQNIYQKATCIDYMAASNVFGGGIGKKKFLVMVQAFPDILKGSVPTMSDLLNTKGVGEKVARQFMEHIADFYEFLEEVGLPCRSINDKIEPTPEGFMSVAGKSIVFTGFRHKELEEFIIRRGGKVGSNVSKATSIVIAKNIEDNSIKSELAKEFGIPLMSYKTFTEETGFIETKAPFHKEEVEKEFEEFQKELEEEGLLEEEGEEDEEDEEGAEGMLNKTAECVRHTMNWANMKRTNIFGKSAYDTLSVQEDLPKSSPKLKMLLKKIRALDEQDQKNHGKLYKHMIFSDVTKRGYGAKIVAAGLEAAGFRHAYDHTFKLNRQQLVKNKFENFAILAATQIYTKPISVEFKKNLLDIYNSRPDNIHGQLIRIMVLDSGYKEGIDLFDVKYVHLFEPILTYADETQAIGRATRFCGQKGLPFEDKVGWKLHVYKYDHVIPSHLAEEFKHQNSLDLILAEMDKNRNAIDLAREIERITYEGSVDHALTKNIHIQMTGGAPKAKIKATKPPLPKSALQRTKPPSEKLSRENLYRYIHTHYPQLQWEEVTLENQCEQKATPSPNALLEFSPSQEFIRQYFQPSNPYKGMFLWHSIGSGKTCTAIGAASYSWEVEGYTILWVTRGTLRSDVYKNMFDNSCLERIRDRICDGYKIPADMTHRKKLLSKSWLPPVSYRQLNNALKRQNKLYDFLVKRNGYSDPFRKTLFIIDEAHLMLSPAIKEKDKPDIQLLKAWLRNSYKLSKENSARVLLMSATPITDNPFNFTPLLNLTDTSDMPEEEDGFIKKYLDKDTLKFTKEGRELFKEDITGRVSYLNRMKDARQFTQPVLYHVNVPISEPTDIAPFLEEMEYLESQIQALKEIKLGDTKKAMVEEIEKKYETPIANCDKEQKAAAKKACISELKKKMREEKEKVDEIARQKVEGAKDKIQEYKESMKEIKQTMKAKKKNDQSILTVLRKRCYKKQKEEDVV
jgi:NAD-dependent DNA ligase